MSELNQKSTRFDKPPHYLRLAITRDSLGLITLIFLVLVNITLQIQSVS